MQAWSSLFQVKPKMDKGFRPSYTPVRVKSLYVLPFLGQTYLEILNRTGEVRVT